MTRRTRPFKILRARYNRLLGRLARTKGHGRCGGKAEHRGAAAIAWGLEPLEDRVLLSSYSLQTLGTFSGANGMNPWASVILDSSGNLYGTTAFGGMDGDGAVVELPNGSHAITALASFDGSNGANPWGNLIVDSHGNLYGTMYYGGAEYGGIFELAAGTTTVTTLATFDSTNGANPVAGLTVDGSGNLYGTTYYGGANNDGAVFELAKGGSTISTLASFDVSNGENPAAGVVLDGSGNLYGAAYAGGGSGDGTIYEIAQGSNAITTLATFNVTNGQNPQGGLVLNGGNLYGTARLGGANGDGTVFEVAQGSSTITTLATFDGTNGANPIGGLIMDSQGDLFDTTLAVTGGDGTAFEVAQGTNAITTLATFTGTNGDQPKAGLVMDAGGNLYGTTSAGGADSDGIIFELSPIPGPAHSLVFASTPASATAGAAIAPAVTVDVEDASGVLVTTDNSDVTLTITSDSGPEGGVLSGTLTEPAVDGVATFSDLSLNKPGTYTLTATDGSLIAATSNSIGVTATPIITWANPADITYGTALSGTQLDATANVPGTFVYTPATGTVLSAGAHTLNAIFTPTDTTDYTAAEGSAQITVDQATPVVTWTTPTSITYGTPLSSAQLDATASSGGTTVPGTYVYTPAAGAVLAPGANQSLSVVFTPTDTTDYTTANGSAQITVNQATPVITWANPANIAPGAALSATQLDATANVAGEFVYTPAAGAVLSAGTHTLTAVFTPTNTTDYTIVNASAQLTVGPSIATLTTNGPVVKGASLTLTAAGVTTDSSATMKRVYFYLDSLGTGVFNAAKDRLLGVGKLVTGTDNYSLAISTASLQVGTVGFFARALDSKGLYTSAVSATATITDTPPTITRLTANPAAPAAGLPVTLRAVGVADRYNTVATVDFYWNPTGADTISGAVLLGSSTAKKAWALTVTLNSATASPAFPTTGTATFLAVAVDASNTASVAPTVLTAGVNTPPVMTGLSTSAATVDRTKTLTLTATGVTDANDKFKVAFYRGAIGTTTLNTSTAVLLGYGKLVKNTTNYALTVKISASLPLGTYPFFAVAVNNHGAQSNVTSATATVADDPPAIAKLTVATVHVAADSPVTLKAGGVTDGDGTVSQVNFYWVYDGTSELLGSATVAQGWTLTATLPSATDPDTPFPTSGPVTFEAQAVDNLGVLGNLASAVVDVG